MSFIFTKKEEGKYKMTHDYKKIYREHYGPIPEGWEVHHIDYNHSNNHHRNLVALPSDVHKKLHRAYNELMNWNVEQCIQDGWLRMHSGKINNQCVFMQALYDYVSIIEECVKYVNYRDGEV